MDLSFDRFGNIDALLVGELGARGSLRWPLDCGIACDLLRRRWHVDRHLGVWMRKEVAGLNNERLLRWIEIGEEYPRSRVMVPENSFKIKWIKTFQGDSGYTIWKVTRFNKLCVITQLGNYDILRISMVVLGAELRHKWQWKAASIPLWRHRIGKRACNVRPNAYLCILVKSTLIYGGNVWDRVPFQHLSCILVSRDQSTLISPWPSCMSTHMFLLPNVWHLPWEPHTCNWWHMSPPLVVLVYLER